MAMKSFGSPEPRITVLNDVHTGEFYELPACGGENESRKISVGRSKHCDLQIPDIDEHSKLVSEVHCHISLGEYEVFDAGSEFGTYVDKQGVCGNQRFFLADGRELLLGGRGHEGYSLRVLTTKKSNYARQIKNIGRTPIKVECGEDN